MTEKEIRLLEITKKEAALAYDFGVGNIDYIVFLERLDKLKMEVKELEE